MSTTEPLAKISLPVILGQEARLGLLYDARRGEFLGGQSAPLKAYGGAVHSTPNGFTHTQYMSSNTLAEELELLDITGELKVTVLWKIKAKGSAAYHSKEVKSLETESITVHSIVVDRTDHLYFGKEYQRAIDDCVRTRLEGGIIKPTHVVNSVTYGKTITMRLTRRKAKGTGATAISGELAGKFSLAKIASAAAALDIHSEDSQNTVDTYLHFELESCGHDILTQPTSLKEAEQLYSALLGAQGRSVPIRMEMEPIGWTGSEKTAICYRVGEGVCNSLIKAYSDLVSVQSSLDSISNTLELEFGETARTLRHQVKQSLERVTSKVVSLSDKFQIELVAVRTEPDKHGREELAKLLHDIWAASEQPDERNGTPSARSDVEDLSARLGMLQHIRSALAMLGTALSSAAEAADWLLMPEERIVVLVWPCCAVADLAELQVTIPALRGWLKHRSGSTDDATVESIYADAAAVAQLSMIDSRLTRSTKPVEIHVLRQRVRGSSHRWSRLGDAWHCLINDDGIYIGEVKSLDGNLEKSGEGRFESASSKLVYAGSWRNDMKHGPGYETGHPIRPVISSWLTSYGSRAKPAIWQYGELGGMHTFCVNVHTAGRSFPVVLSNADSADQVIASIREELDHQQLYRSQNFSIRIRAANCSLAFPFLYSRITYGDDGWTAGMWGLCSRDAKFLSLSIELDASTEALGAEFPQNAPRFKEPSWQSFLQEMPGPGFGWSGPNETGCHDLEGDQRPLCIAKSERRVPSPNSPAPGAVLGKTGQHLEDGCYYAYYGKEYAEMSHYHILVNPGDFEWVQMRHGERLDPRRWPLLAAFDSHRRPLFVARRVFHSTAHIQSNRWMAYHLHRISRKTGGRLHIIPGYSHGRECHAGSGLMEFISTDGDVFDVLCQRRLAT